MAYNLRRARVGHGVLQEQLATDIGVDRSYLGGLERQVENPTVDLHDRLADNLVDVKLADLFVEPADEEPSPAPLRGGRRAG